MDLIWTYNNNDNKIHVIQIMKLIVAIQANLMLLIIFKKYVL